MDTRYPRRQLRKLRRFRRSITLELFAVMTGLLFLSLAVIVVGSDRFLRETGAELVADQDRVAKQIIEESAAALKNQAEDNLGQLIRDKAERVDQSFAQVERIVNLTAASAERLLKFPEEARDVEPVESRVFNDPKTRPKDFREEPGKNRKVSLRSVIWHRAPGADVQVTERTLYRLRGLGFTMQALYREHPLADWIYIGTTDGIFFGYPGDDSIEARYDHRSREWYRMAVASREPTWSEVYVDPSGALTVTCAKPFFHPDSKELAGVVAVDVTLHQLNALLAELEAGVHGYPFIVDGKGKLVTRPSVDGTLWNALFEKDDLLASADPGFTAVVQRMVGDESGVAKLAVSGAEEYVAFAHIPSTDWSIGFLLPVEEIVGRVRRHEGALQDVFRAGQAHIGARVDDARSRFLKWGIFGVVFLLVWTTGFVYARLTHPIKGFIRDLRVISRGDLDHVVESPTNNELAELANAVNDMTHDLKRSRDQIEDHSRTLERKVEERTAELASSNGELADTIRKLRDAQSALVHSEKMASLGQLVAGIAHEINNPVNFIANSVGPLQGALEDMEKVARLRESGAPDEEVRALKEEIGFEEAFDQMRRALELIKTGASRTKAIVLQLRNFSRLDEAEMKDADVHEGIDSSLALLNYKIKDRIDVVRNYGAAGRLLCYPGQLNQVFMNVLANAVQAIESKEHPATGEFPVGQAPPKGRIEITTLRHGETVEIRIKDDGPGIPPKALGRIFDPFFTTKDKERGTGLGLSISHGIVEKHGGRIEVVSEVGKGAEFVITLPAAVRVASPAPVRSGGTR